MREARGHLVCVDERGREVGKRTPAVFSAEYRRPDRVVMNLLEPVPYRSGPVKGAAELRFVCDGIAFAEWDLRAYGVGPEDSFTLTVGELTVTG